MDLASWLAIIRDGGLVLGVPTLIFIGIRLYRRQIKVLETYIESLKLTQYDRALSIIEAQRRLFEMDRADLEAKLSELKGSDERKERELRQTTAQLEEVRQELASLENRRQAIARSAEIISVKTFDMIDVASPSTDEGTKRQYFRWLVEEAMNRAHKDFLYIDLPEERKELINHALVLARNRASEVGLAEDWDRWILDGRPS